MFSDCEKVERLNFVRGTHLLVELILMNNEADLLGKTIDRTFVDWSLILKSPDVCF